MIDIKIFHVDQGFCCAIELSKQNTILIDCGSGKNFQPAQYVWQRHCKYLDYLILPAYTTDHLAGFSGLVSQSFQHDIPIHFLAFNPTLNPEQLSDSQPFPLPLGNCLYKPIGNSYTIDIDELKLTFFWNSFSDNSSNYSLSLVTFVHYADINLILPSDLDEMGWRNLLNSYEFRRHLEKVNFFVASNHGREIGYCKEVFNYCHPDVIIVSNKDNQPLSPEMKEIYVSHAKGVIAGVNQKKILSTHEDGTIKISKYLDKLREVTTQKQLGLSAYLD
jgi:beta-lactamase superfamily II metal-dependent hydrolase